MTIRSRAELFLMIEIGKVVRRTLDAMERAIRPGLTTAELDAVAADVLARSGARSAPRLVYSFPGSTCISVNEEVVHGVPGARVLEPGDLVKIDVVAEKDGHMADAARTVVVPPASDQALRLIACARDAFEKGLSAARAGFRVRDIGHQVEAVVEACGFAVMRDLAGHGVGHSIHEEPTVPNFYDHEQRRRLELGMVIALEPIISAGSGESYTAPDGWTVRTLDRSLAAHHEHTLVIGDGAPRLLTAA